MKSLLLSAGRGTRLSPITDECPKSMVPVNGKPILVKQIENLVENGIADITIVAGYKADILIHQIHSKFPFVNIMNNCEYAATNNMYSAYLARKSIGDEPFIMMNSDVYFDSTVLKALLSYETENAIVTDIGRYMEESMKVVEKGGRLVKIGKNISKADTLGCSIDIYKFSRSANRAFFSKCEEYIERKKERNLWTEVAINDILKDVEFAACPLNGRWVEIDNHEDLAAAVKLFSV